MTSPRPIIETEVVQYGRRKPTMLRLDLETCRQAMAELARAERILLAAAAAADGPAPDEAAGPRNQGPVCACGHQLGAHFASGLCSAGSCRCREPRGTIAVSLGQPAGEAPAEAGEEVPGPADGPAPHHAGPGEPRCEAYDDVDGEGWLCTAQAGHGGPDHLAYREDGTIARRWPAAAAAAPGKQDPYHTATMPACRCTHPVTEHSIRLIDRSRGACTTGCGCIRYQPRPPAALAAVAGLR